MSTAAAAAQPGTRLADLVPGIAAALSFSAADILGKVVFNSGMDVLSLVSLRGVLAVGFFWLWLRQSPSARRHTPRERRVALGLGLVFAANIFGLLLAIRLLPLSVAILTYFVYPLATGIAGAALGLERLSWRGFLCALAAFAGLALMLGAKFSDLAPLGVAASLGAAVFRVISLLVTRGVLMRADARLTTWYSLTPSAAIFVLVSLGLWHFQAPDNLGGWAAFVGMSVTTTLSTLWVYVSTLRVGPFRTALVMNLEPLMSTLGSVVLLGEVMQPAQALGGALMIGALCVFQMRR
jgi:drug/metabolite transporter (DMT)-like permease